MQHDEEDRLWRPDSAGALRTALDFNESLSALPLQVTDDSAHMPSLAHQSEQDGLFDFLEDAEPDIVIKKRKKPRMTAGETQVALKARAAKGWLRVILINPKASQAGRKAVAVEDSGDLRLDVILCYLEDKAPNTAIQRLAPVSLLANWSQQCIQHWPPNEETLGRYMQETASKSIAKTTYTRLIESVKFMAGVFQFAKSLLVEYDSRYLNGKALRQLKLMPKPVKAKALSLEFVAQLEHFFLHTKVVVELRMVAGGLLILVYFRIRFSDADEILEVVMFEDRITLQVRETKTSLVRQLVILMTTVNTLTGEEWFEEFQEWRSSQGAPLADGWPLFPTRANGRWEKVQCRVDDINELFWVIQLRICPAAAQALRKRTHSCKYAFLDAAVIYGISKPARKCLGYHKDSSDRSVDTYAPSTQIEPVRQLGQMVKDYSLGIFDPDRLRRPRAKQVVTARQSELTAQSSSSSEASADEDEEGEPTMEVQELAAEQIVEAINDEPTPSDLTYLNVLNNKVHKGRINDLTLTWCGNPIGTNIVPMSSGAELGEIDVELICQNCYGRSLAIRQAVARRLSEPTEPLETDLAVK